jgi:hypothetical protein
MILSRIQIINLKMERITAVATTISMAAIGFLIASAIPKITRTRIANLTDSGEVFSF